MAQSTQNPENGEEKGGSAPPCTHGRGVCSLGAGGACAQLRVPARFLPAAAPRGCQHPPRCPDGAGATRCSQQAPARGKESSTSVPGSAGALSHPKTSSSPPGPRGTAAPRWLRRLSTPRGSRMGARGPAAPCSPPCPRHGHLHGAGDAGGMPVGCRGRAQGLAASRRPPAPLLGPRHPPPGPIVLPRRAAGQDSFVRAEQYFILTINQTRPGSRACL